MKMRMKEDTGVADKMALLLFGLCAGIIAHKVRQNILIGTLISLKDFNENRHKGGYGCC